MTSNRSTEQFNGSSAIELFLKLAQIDPELPFLSVGAKRLNRGQFVTEIIRFGLALTRAGILRDDVVVVCTPNCIEWCIAFWGAVSIGARPAPLDPAIGSWELQRHFAILKPRLAVVSASYRGSSPAARLKHVMASLPLVVVKGDAPSSTRWEDFTADLSVTDFTPLPITPEEILHYACTSGTTGNPKILAVPHGGFLRSQMDMAAYLGLESQDRMLLGMPLFHQGGFGMGLQALAVGAEARYVETFTPESFICDISESGATVVQLSPTLAKLLLTSPRFAESPHPQWRMAYFAGELLADDLAATFFSDLQLRVVNVVGSSETATMLVWDSKYDRSRSASEFTALSFTQARVLNDAQRDVEVGETGVLWVHTDGLLSHYEGNPQLTQTSFRDEPGRRWFCTGDLFQKLPNERFRFAGRVKRVIKRGPNLVHPEELEAFLLGHSEIAAVAVSKEPHPIFGESIVAWIQPIPTSKIDRGAILAYCREQISSYKIPDQIRMVEHIPSDIGKVQHRRLPSPV